MTISDNQPETLRGLETSGALQDPPKIPDAPDLTGAATAEQDTLPFPEAAPTDISSPPSRPVEAVSFPAPDSLPAVHTDNRGRKTLALGGAAGLLVLGVGVVVGSQLGGDSDEPDRTTAEAPPSTDFEATDPGESVVTTVPPETAPETTVAAPEGEVTSGPIPMLEDHARNLAAQEGIYIQPNNRLYPRPNEQVLDMITDNPQVLMENTLHNLEAMVNFNNKFAYDLVFPEGEADPANGFKGDMEEVALDQTINGSYYIYYVGRLHDADLQGDAGTGRLLVEFFIYDTDGDGGENGGGSQVNFILNYAKFYEADGSYRWILTGGENFVYTDYYTLEEADQNPIG